jgi:dTDP-glucose pyrophosphorylase
MMKQVTTQMKSNVDDGVDNRKHRDADGLNKFVISLHTTVIDAMSAIDKNATGTVYICDDKGVVKAVVSDGDIRRYILAGGDLNAPALSAANKEFRYLVGAESIGTDGSGIGVYDIEKEARILISKYVLRSLPIVDASGRLNDIVLEKGKAEWHGIIEAPVVIMAGGKGTRLYPYTKILPKPLIPVGDLTITEVIIARFREFGANDFTIILGHMKNMIKAYFTDKFVDDEYLLKFVEEDRPLGTGGGLNLLKGVINDTFILTNCDILIYEDYSEIIKHHREQKNVLTMICCAKQVTIPYGTVEIDDQGKATAFVEKPSYSFLTNSGLYIIEPEFLQYVPDDTAIHITDVIGSLISEGKRIGVYPVSEDNWYDMGQPDELERMKKRIEVE